MTKNDKNMKKKIFTRDELNPILFDESGNLYSDISDRLLRIAYDFQESLPFDYELVDIVLTGSNASYQWVKGSDLDLHIVVNFGEHKEMKFNIGNLARQKWNTENDITIKGMPVEVYVESFDEQATSDGIYSIKNGIWVKKPIHPKEMDIKENPDEVYEIYQEYMKRIVEIEKGFKNGTFTASEVLSKSKALSQELKNDRQSNLDKGGTFSSGNLAYKLLRLTGYLSKLYSVMKKAYDTSLSLESIEENEVITDTATIISAAPESLTKYLGVDKNKLFDLIKRSKKDGNIYNEYDMPIFTVSSTGSDGIYQVDVKLVDESKRYFNFKKKFTKK
jgi:predicted nucleotidyltransferase